MEGPTPICACGTRTRSGYSDSPHGFEGFCFGAGHSGCGDLPVADGERLEVVEVDVNAAPPATVALIDLDDHVVAVVFRDKPLELDRLPCLKPVAPELTEPVVPAIEPGHVRQLESGHVPHDLLVCQIKGGTRSHGAVRRDTPPS